MSGDGTTVTPTSGTVVYLADQTTPGVFELFLATSGTKLNPPLAANRRVTSFALTPDATAVVYIADQDFDDVFELYRVSLAKPGDSTKLNPAFAQNSGKEVKEFAVTPDGTSVLYIADQDQDDVFEIYRTALATLVNSKLNPPYDVPPKTGQDVDAFVILPNSNGVIYRADQTTDGVSDLYRVLFATAPLFDTLTSLGIGQNVGAFAATPDSLNVVYIANRPLVTDPNQLFIVPAGGGGSIPLNDILVAGGNVTDFAVTPNGLSVVYRADQVTDEVFELFGVTLAAPGISTKLNGPLASCVPGPAICGDVTTSFGVIPDSSGLVYIADQNTDEVFELFRTVFSGGNSQLNPPFVGPEDVTDFVLFPNAAGVVYRADQNTDGVKEIYRVVFGFPGSVRLNPGLAIGQNVEEGYAVAPDSLSAIYRADLDTPGIIELYRTMFSSPGSSTKLNSPPLTVGKNVADFAVR